jgi:hypothetical protein
MILAIKKDFDRMPESPGKENQGYSDFRRENGGLSLFCSWINQREIGIADLDERIVLWDHPKISCSGVFVRQSSQIKNLSSKTNPD